MRSFQNSPNKRHVKDVRLGQNEGKGVVTLKKPENIAKTTSKDATRSKGHRY